MQCARRLGRPARISQVVELAAAMGLVCAERFHPGRPEEGLSQLERAQGERARQAARRRPGSPPSRQCRSACGLFARVAWAARRAVERAPPPADRLSSWPIEIAAGQRLTAAAAMCSHARNLAEIRARPSVAARTGSHVVNWAAEGCPKNHRDRREKRCKMAAVLGPASQSGARESVRIGSNWRQAV
jgi:hypothetical protein